MAQHRSSIKESERNLPASQDRANDIARWLLPVAVVLVTFVSFLPALQNGFVDWDDDANFRNNPHYRGLGWGQLRWMFTTFHLGPYQPLSWVTLGLDFLNWGMNPVGYHLTSLLLHCISALVFYFVAARLLALVFALPRQELSLRLGAGLAALLFAIHPLRVESVAWVTERRDVLSGLFFLLTVLFYLNSVLPRADHGRRKPWMVFAIVFYALSLLSKASGMTLPVVLLVLDVYPIRRWHGGPAAWRRADNRKLLLEKLPFAVLALLCGIVALLAQSGAGALKSLESYGLARRLAQACYGIIFYLWKTLLPINLSPIYGIPIHLSAGDWARFIISGFLVVGITAGLMIKKERWPALLAIWVCYVALIAPVSGIAQAGPQLVADRYSYLPSLGWALLGGGAIFCSWIPDQRGSGAGLFRSAVAFIIVVTLAMLTWSQSAIWFDARTLWTHAVRTDPLEPRARNYLGFALVNREEIAKGIAEYREALRLEPDYRDAHHNLATALTSQGDLAQAVEQFRDALRIDPTYKEALNNLGVALAQSGEFTQAIEQFRAALRIDPEYLEARKNLESLLEKHQAR